MKHLLTAVFLVLISFNASADKIDKLVVLYEKDKPVRDVSIILALKINEMIQKMEASHEKENSEKDDPAKKKR